MGFALLVGVVLFAVGAVIEARRRRDLDLLPDFLMFIGGSMVMWMAAKLLWTDDLPGWFGMFVTVGWLIILAMTMNLIRHGVLL
jgi:hypothetical protein